MDLTTSGDVADYMKAATSEQDWNDRADQVKAANGGYPSFWFSTIMLSGLAADTQSKW